MKSILFNPKMVCAILDGRKTVTRKIIKEPWYIDNEEVSRVSGLAMHRGLDCTHGMPYQDQLYRPGDILYVRESWTVWDGNYEYKADVDDGYGPFCSNCTLDICAGGCNSALKWRPSIYMPREAARIFLRVTGVRVERLQDITKWEAVAEGNPKCAGLTVCGGTSGCHLCEADSGNSVKWFARVWDSAIKPADRTLYGWEANPWCWVITFERISKEEA